MYAARLADVRRRIDDAARRSGRDPRDVTLVAVTKGASDEAALALHAAGARDFAERRVDELAAREKLLPADARWHFIGNLQRNKLTALRETGALVHSFDRAELAPLMGDLRVLVQVDYTGLPQRNGVPEVEVPRVLDALDAASVACVGLSTLPPRDADPRATFRALRALRDQLAPSRPGLRELSMGMSADFEAAVEEGATLVRVGRALVG